jgi:hypothetical protein
MDPPAPIKRLADALNAHDPIQVEAAFHSGLSPRGSDRIPNLRAEVLRWIIDGDVSWSEW